MLYIPYPFKRCSHCHRFLIPSEFHKNRIAKDKLDPQCKRCKSIRAAKARRENPEKYRERNQQYRQQYPEKVKASEEKYRRNRPERVRLKQKKWNAAHIEQIRRMSHIWGQKNPDKRRMYAARRKAKILQAEGTYTSDDVQKQYKRQKGRCYYCGEKLDKNYHVDHVIPLSRGGANGPDNIVVACPFCNESKNDRMPHEWPEGGRLC